MWRSSWRRKTEENDVKLYTWEKSQGASWERIMVVAASLDQARILATAKEPMYLNPNTAMPVVTDLPIAIYDIH